MLRCIAFQIVSQNSEYGSFAAIVCRDERRLRVAEDTWNSLFMAYFPVDRFQGSARVVIDGVDEAPLEEQRLLFRLMKMLRAREYQNKCRLQFLFLGRPEIEAQREGSTPTYIEVSAVKMSKDVNKYIEQNIRRVKLLRSRDISENRRVHLKRMIVERLQRGASGMFLWVRLVLEEFMNQPRPSDVERILASPPMIFQLLESIIERLGKHQTSRRNDLREILV